jgi:hypothetical protein
MGIFQADKTLLTWQEPFLFAARTRDRRGWTWRGVLALVIFIGMMLAFAAERNWGARRRNFSLAGATALSAVIGLFLTAMLDATGLNRQITISKQRITAFGNAGHHVSMENWSLSNVHWIRLWRPPDFQRTFGAMDIQTSRGLHRVGVPAKMSMSRIADALHHEGVRVILSDWEPAPEPTAAPVSRREGLAVPEATTTASARIERLPEYESSRILSPFHFRFALTLSMGPFVVALIAGIGLLGYGIVQTMILRRPASLADAATIVGGIGLLVGGFWYGLRLSNLVPSLYIFSVARSVIGQRPGTQFDPTDSEVVYIDVIPRANWGKVLLRHFSDTGLLKVDALSRAILFEGDLERWRVPISSLRSVAVESYRPAGHVEGQEGGERYFVTVIRANVNGESWEAPVSKCHVEFRPKNNELREANAHALCDRIRALDPARLGIRSSQSPLAAANPL